MWGMFRAVIVVVASALVLGAIADLRLVAWDGDDQGAVDRACDDYKHRAYKHRAGPRPTTERATFVGLLSEICVAARQSLDSASPEEQAAAGLLLSQIVLLHRTVDEMNAARDLAVPGKIGVARMQAVRRVTRTGEFLIAHRMGLMHAIDAWLDSGANFSLAFYR